MIDTFANRISTGFEAARHLSLHAAKVSGSV